MKQVAIITGGSKGIGFAIAKKLGLLEYQIVILSRQSEIECKKALEEIKQLGISFLYLQGDITSAADRERLIEKTLSKFGAIHILVNNAGTAPLQRNDLLEMNETSFDHVLNINTKGTFFLSQIVAKQILSQDPIDSLGRRGTIINISSISAQVASIDRGEYCISKAAMGMITQLFAIRLARAGILVYEIRPGIIDTDMTKPVHQKYDKMLEIGAFPLSRWGNRRRRC